MDLPDDAREYYRQVESEVMTEITDGLDPVMSEITLKTFVSTSKGSGRKRSRVKEITLIKYGRNYHMPHKFGWWTAGLELIGDMADVESQLMARVLGNQAYNLNTEKRGYYV